MNQAEIQAQRNAARIVSVTNPYDFDFTHAWGGVPYTLPMGKPVMLPFPLADHLVTHLVRQALIRKAPRRDEGETDGRGKDRPLWSDEIIEELKAGIMHEEYTEEIQTPLTEMQIMARKIEELQRAFEDKKSAAVETAEAEPAAEASPSGFKDKAEVIAELTKKGIKFDARKGKADLEKLLA